MATKNLKALQNRTLRQKAILTFISSVVTLVSSLYTFGATSETTLEEREALCRQFELRELLGLVAIRCLNEGAGILAIETAMILASSGNPRQFVQRRKRILRPHPYK
ncbi:hypothetical protein H6F76_18830 [Leptolyngbya sp. FACHB-321]|nr:helicase-related protein [Leptolyngbya sp. FACHB-321]MBD2037029.1 hypothetical protein [Leptolyngbya sp. FACHB-321]